MGDVVSEFSRIHTNQVSLQTQPRDAIWRRATRLLAHAFTPCSGRNYRNTGNERAHSEEGQNASSEGV